MSKELGREIRRNLEQYEKLRVNGGHDQFWPDGVNMNLCRNHIIYIRKRIVEELDPGTYPEEFSLEIPEEVNDNYMANPSEILNGALAVLEVLEKNEDFRYLKEKLGENLDKEAEKCMNPVRYVMGLKATIEGGNLVEMRRCQETEYYIKYLRDSHKKLDEILKTENLEPELPEGQLSIWDFIGGRRWN